MYTSVYAYDVTNYFQFDICVKYVGICHQKASFYSKLVICLYMPAYGILAILLLYFGLHHTEKAEYKALEICLHALYECK